MSERRQIMSAWVAVILCLLTSIVWVRSYIDSDWITYQYQSSPFAPTVIVARAIIGVGGLDLTLNTGVRSYSPAYNGLQFETLPGSYFGQAGILENLLSFYLVGSRSQQLPWYYGRPSRTFGIGVPLWFVAALWLVWPIALALIHRRKMRWRVREDVQWRTPRLGRLLRRFVIFAIAGIISGIAMSWINVRFEWWQLNWILELSILLPVVVALVVFTRRRIRWCRGLLWMSLELAGYVCFLSATIENWWHFFGGYWMESTDLLRMVLTIWLMSLAAGSAILLLLQLKPRQVKSGPYCPECEYCLIGSPRQICPECGRPFTLEELGVSAEALIPPGVISAS
jgi:hypothetical protein